MIAHSSKLEALLRARFCWHKRRVNLMALFMASLIKVRTVNQTQVAPALNPQVNAASNYRLLQLETLFGAFKTCGFDFEATRLTHPERIQKLMALWALTFA